MAEFIVNPRRAPRAPARCRTAVVASGVSFEAETEDIGARGCQVVSPKGVKQGDPVRVTIANDRLPETLRVGGRIAWVSAQFPWRVGIAFDEGALPKATAWFQRLVDAYPGMRTLKRLPERIPMSAMVYLGAPPRFLHDFTADEAALLRAIGSGAAAYELMGRFRLRGGAMERALFSLIARSAVTLARGQAVHPQSWKGILDEVEASLAVAALGTGPASLAAPPERPSATPVPAATPIPAATPVPAAAADPWAAAPGRSAPSVPPAARAAPRGAERAETGVTWGHGGRSLPPQPGARPAATPPPVRVRNPEAQALLDRAQAEHRAGNAGDAVALLRRALALEPGDAEIAAILGKVAFGGRDPGAR